MNAVLAIVHILPADKIVKEQDEKAVGDASMVKEEAKDESTALSGEDEQKPPVDGQEGKDVKLDESGHADDEVKPDADDEDMDDEVPYIEDVGTREVAGFIVM